MGHKQLEWAVGWRWGVRLAMFFIGGLVLARGVTFTASLERDSISLGESTGLQLTFDGAQPETPPALPSIPNLQIRYVGPASQVSFVNGQVSSRLTHNYSVTPRQPGDFTIPSVTAEVGGQKLATRPVRLTVTPPDSPPKDAAAASGELAFMRIALPKTNLYLGEVLLAACEIYLRDEVDGWGQFQFTAQPVEGATVSKTVEGQHRRVRLGNASFTVVPLQLTITPIKTGPVTVGPWTATISHAQRARNQHEMFFGAPRVAVPLVTDQVTVQCQPVPIAEAPAGFAGAVGVYEMAVSVGPTNVATGDPITVRVEIRGRGALDALVLPEQAAWQNFKTYPPTARVEPADGLGLSGTKIFEQIISPENADLRELPPLTFSFFNPDAGEFRTLTHPAVALTVRPGGSVATPVVAANLKSDGDAVTPPQQDIVPLKNRLGKLRRLGSASGLSPAFVMLNLTPVVALLGVWGWRKRTDALANNPRRRRQLHVESVIRAGLVRLRQLAAANQSDEFFAELMRLLQEKLGERLNLPAMAITESVIDEALKPRGLPDSTLDQIRELFQANDQARYAPVRSSAGLAAFLSKLETVLRKLEEVKS